MEHANNAVFFLAFFKVVIFDDYVPASRTAARSANDSESVAFCHADI
jgi:hypothetical protein